MNHHETNAIPATLETAELAARLAKAQREREAMAQKRASAKEVDALRESVELEERALKEDQILEDLEAKHGPLGRKIARIQTDEGMVVVAAPGGSRAPLFQRFQDEGKFTVTATGKLVRGCLLYPDKAEFDRIVTELPGVLGPCANAIALLAGVRKEENEGK